MMATRSTTTNQLLDRYLGNEAEKRVGGQRPLMGQGRPGSARHHVEEADRKLARFLVGIGCFGRNGIEKDCIKRRVGKGIGLILGLAENGR